MGEGVRCCASLFGTFRVLSSSARDASGPFAPWAAGATCTCPAFTHDADAERRCKHIAEAERLSCRWHEGREPRQVPVPWAADGYNVPLAATSPPCPECGGPTFVVGAA